MDAAARDGRARDAAAPRLRIAFLIWRDTSHPDGGGSEVFVEEIASRLATAGHEVTILCAAHDNAPRDEMRGGVRFRRRGGRLGVYLRGLMFLLRHSRSLDVVIDVQNGVPFFSPLVRRRPIVVLVHHVHREQWEIIYPGWRGSAGWWMESWLSPRLYRSQRYVTVSEASRSDLISLGIAARRIELVHNGIEVPHPRRTVPRRPAPTLCVLGRLVPHKQVEHAFEAAAELRAEFPDLHVDVVGEGWWHEPLVRRATDLGIADIVTFHGHVSDVERGEILDRSWVLLAPSVKEGWGIAIMEAAARGVPAIAYRSGGGVNESVLDRQTGRLVDDLEELTKTAAELLSDAELRERLGARARARAAAFEWASSARMFEEVLASALER